MNPYIQDNTVSLKRTLEASGLRTECSKGGPKRRQPEWGGGGQDSVPQKDGGQRGLSVADGRATAGDCLRFGRLLYGRSPGLIPTHQHPRNPPARAQPFTNTFGNLRQKHFTIGDKYITIFETNTFCKLRQIHLALALSQPSILKILLPGPGPSQRGHAI